MHPLIGATALARSTVIIGDVSVLVISPTIGQQVSYAELAKEDKVAAMAWLIHACVINEDGTPAMSAEDAEAVARGRGAALLELIPAILSAGQKKAEMTKGV